MIGLMDYYFQKFEHAMGNVIGYHQQLNCQWRMTPNSKLVIDWFNKNTKKTKKKKKKEKSIFKLFTLSFPVKL